MNIKWIGIFNKYRVNHNYYYQLNKGLILVGSKLEPPHGTHTTDQIES